MGKQASLSAQRQLEKSKSATASQTVSELEQGALSPAVPEWQLHGAKQEPQQRAHLNSRNIALSKKAVYLCRYGALTTVSLREMFVKGDDRSN